jgi:hypothetical protein
MKAGARGMTAEVYTSCGALCTHLAFLIEGSYSNYISDEGDAFARASYGPNYDRLVAIKNAFRVYHSNNPRNSLGRDSAFTNSGFSIASITILSRQLVLIDIVTVERRV